MPGSIAKKALNCFQHIARTKQHQPFPSATIKYGAETKYATQSSKALLLDATSKKFIQQVCAHFILGCAVDTTILCPISTIASQSANPTDNTMTHTKQFIDYVAT